MYKNKIAVSLKHNNKPLLEKGDTFFLPFDTNYSIFIKNLNNKNAIIKIIINGELAVNEFQLNKFENIDIKSFDSGHEFLFVEKSLELQKNRESNIEDSLIELKISFLEDRLPFEYKPGILDIPQFDFIYNEKDLKKEPYPKDHIYCSNSLNTSSGLTVRGKKIKGQKQESKFKDSFNNETFSIIMKLSEFKEIKTKENSKKNCPTCSKTFKHTYFYCPYDGSYLKNN